MSTFSFKNALAQIRACVANTANTVRNAFRSNAITAKIRRAVRRMNDIANLVVIYAAILAAIASLLAGIILGIYLVTPEHLLLLPSSVDTAALTSFIGSYSWQMQALAAILLVSFGYYVGYPLAPMVLAIQNCLMSKDKAGVRSVAEVAVNLLYDMLWKAARLVLAVTLVVGILYLIK